MKEIDINNKEQILNECDFNYYNKSECSRELCTFYNDIFIFGRMKEYNHRQALVDLGRIAITLNNQSKQIEELKQQLAITEKALELACDKLAYKYCFQMGEDAFCGDCKPCLIDYFKQQAKEMLENE